MWRETWLRARGGRLVCPEGRGLSSSPDPLAAISTQWHLCRIRLPLPPPRRSYRPPRAPPAGRFAHSSPSLRRLSTACPSFSGPSSSQCSRPSARPPSILFTSRPPPPSRPPYIRACSPSPRGWVPSWGPARGLPPSPGTSVGRRLQGGPWRPPARPPARRTPCALRRQGALVLKLVCLPIYYLLRRSPNEPVLLDTS
jgi:hypothetical protein